MPFLCGEFTVGFFVGVFPLMLAMNIIWDLVKSGCYNGSVFNSFAFLQYPLGAISR